MSLPASLIDTPMYDAAGKLSFAWLMKFSQIGQTVPVQAMLYGSSAQRQAANRAELPDGVLWFETDTENLYRLKYEQNAANWYQLDYVRGSDALTDPNRVVKVGATAGSLAEAAYLDSDVVLGAPTLVHAGRLVEVSSAGHVTESPPGASQTPWVTDIDAANHGLDNLSHLGIGRVAGLPLHIKVGTDQNFYCYSSGGNATIGSINDATSVLMPLALAASAIVMQLGGGGVGIGRSPSYALDVGGDINTTTGYRQGGFVGLNTTIVLAKLTPTTGVNGSITVRGGIITGYTAPT